jgi:hypothetical protein
MKKVLDKPLKILYPRLVDEKKETVEPLKVVKGVSR